MSMLTVYDGFVYIDGEEVPGLLTGMTVAGKVEFDEAKSDGQSGKKKTPMGYEDATVNIELLLFTDDDEDDDPKDCYDKLDVINKIFKATGPKAAPKIVKVLNRHIIARGVEQMVFSGLSSRENNKDDTIKATLTFVEHNPPVAKVEKRVNKKTMKDQKAKAEEKKEAAKSAAPEAKPKETTVTVDANARG